MTHHTNTPVLSEEPTTRELGELIIQLNHSTKEELRAELNKVIEVIEEYVAACAMWARRV